ncbi:MAG TPA: protein-methionine-sulfoxide reductase catalytic subunit MsrP, partial [Vicinamibacterales bacterium]|nr:protein-methionine-sulfoxide reductase catalytic subunit MsrP [Vicinamibacterales bacterium]
MLIKKPSDIRSSEITPKELYQTRRQFIKTAGMAAGAAVGVGVLTKGAAVLHAVQPAAHRAKLPNVKPNPAMSNTNGEVKNTWEQITTYNNYYEFGIDKNDPAELSRNFKTDGWMVDVSGECAKKGKYSIDDILKGETVEERVYRHRCVEAWSMVIPWVGFPLADLIKKCEPTSKAKYVEFTTFFDTKQMSARTSAIRYPYVEGLRM